MQENKLGDANKALHDLNEGLQHTFMKKNKHSKKHASANGTPALSRPL
jgi:hypothetical protein